MEMKSNQVILVSLLLFLSLSTCLLVIRNYILENLLREANEVIAEKSSILKELKERYIESLKIRSRLRKRLSNLYDKYYNLLAKLKELEKAVNSPRRKTEYRNITYEELILFLKNDRTDENTLIMKNFAYVCLDFAIDRRDNANKLGIKCGIVFLYFEHRGHTINAFETTDKGLLFVEPQNDMIFTEQELKIYSSKFGKLIKIEILWE